MVTIIIIIIIKFAIIIVVVIVVVHIYYYYYDYHYFYYCHHHVILITHFIIHIIITGLNIISAWTFCDELSSCLLFILYDSWSGIFVIKNSIMKSCFDRTFYESKFLMLYFLPFLSFLMRKVFSLFFLGSNC